MQTTNLASYEQLLRGIGDSGRPGIARAPRHPEPDPGPEGVYRSSLPWWIYNNPLREPDPMPWHGRQVADFLVLMLGMKQAAATTKDAKLSGEVQGWADGGVKWAIDEFCGTPPYPWPPGPPIRVLELASLLAVIANAMPAGDLKTSLTDLSGSVLKQSIGTSAR